MASNTFAAFHSSGVSQIVTQFKIYPVTPIGTSTTESVVTMRNTTPVVTNKVAYVFPGLVTLKKREEYANILSRFGFKRVVFIPNTSFMTYTSLARSKNKIELAEYTVIFFYTPTSSAFHSTTSVTIANVVIIKKQHNSFKVIRSYQSIDAFYIKKWWPAVKTVIYADPGVMGELKENEKVTLQNQWPASCKTLFVNLLSTQYPLYEYLLDRANNDGLVECYQLYLIFKYNGIQVPMDVSSSEEVIHLDIKNAPMVKIFVRYNNTDDELIKTYKFKSMANRKVAITVNVGDTMIPTFSIETTESAIPNRLPFTITRPFFTVNWCNTSVKLETVVLPKADPPSSRKRRFHIGVANRMIVMLQHNIIEEFPFAPVKDRVVTIECSLDAFSKPNVTLVKEDTVPPIVFEFTTNNRLMVHGPDDYTGPREYPAYASFKDGNLVAGAEALEIYKEHPQSVVFDIPRLLSPDLSAETENPEWQFSFSSDSNGEIVIALENGKTNPYICFALIVKSVLLNVRENYSNPIDRIGIKLPDDYDISDEWENKISEHIGVSILVFN